MIFQSSWGCGGSLCDTTVLLCVPVPVNLRVEREDLILMKNNPGNNKNNNK